MVVKKPGRSRPLGAGQALQPRLDLVLRRTGGIEVGLRRLRRHAGDERLVVIEPRPGSLVDQEVVQPRAAERRVVARQIQQHRLVAVPDLPQEQRVEDLRGLDQLGQRLPLVGRQRRDVGGEIDGRKARGHRLEFLGFWIGGGLRGLWSARLVVEPRDCRRRRARGWKGVGQFH